MKKTILLLPVLMMVAMSACWHQQWEDRLESGDTGIVTHGDKQMQENKVQPLSCGNYYSQLSLRGETLAKAKCGACHSLSHKTIVGPGLYNEIDHLPSRKWAHAFLHNPDSLRKTGDAYSNKIYKEYDKRKHPAFPNLTDADIDELLGYSK